MGTQCLLVDDAHGVGLAGGRRGAGESSERNNTSGEREFHGMSEESYADDFLEERDVELGRCCFEPRGALYLTSSRPFCMGQE